MFYDGEECPHCHSTDVATSYQGRINITNISKSDVAKKAGYDADGEYAIKCR